MRHADSDCQHETDFITLLLSVLLDDVQNHTIGALQPHSRGVWKAFDSGFRSNEEVCCRKLPAERIEEPDCFSSRTKYQGYWSALS